MKRALVLLGLILHTACPLLGAQDAQEHVAELKQLVKKCRANELKEQFDATTPPGEKEIARLLSYAQEKREKVTLMITRLGNRSTSPLMMAQGATVAFISTMIVQKAVYPLCSGLEYLQSWLTSIKGYAAWTSWVVDFPEQYDYENALQITSIAAGAVGVLTTAGGYYYGIKKMYQGLYYKVLLERRVRALDTIIELLEQKNSTQIEG